MQRNAMKIRMLAAAGAVAIVAGTMLGLGGYSNAKFEIAAEAVHRPYAKESVQLAVEPLRIDVVVTRVAGTRTAAQLHESSAARPQS